MKKTCEEFKGNKKDCLIQNTRYNIKELSKFVETHRINNSSNQYMEQIKAKQRLIFYIRFFNNKHFCRMILLLVFLNKYVLFVDKYDL